MRLTRVATTDPIAQERPDKHSRQGDHAEEQLPLGGLADELLALDFNNRRNDGSGEDAVLKYGFAGQSTEQADTAPFTSLTGKVTCGAYISRTRSAHLQFFSPYMSQRGAYKVV